MMVEEADGVMVKYMYNELEKGITESTYGVGRRRRRRRRR